MISVKTWTISQFREAHHNGTLTVSPEYQRRDVWNAKTQMLLVDSLARRIPVGAITLYEDETKGYKVYEVIDGKQRLTALFNYLTDKLVVKDNVVETEDGDDDETVVQGGDLATALYNRLYSELDVAQKHKFTEYEFPVFIVNGPRSAAVQAFTRMNSNLYALKPQEIRNAMFAGTYFLQRTISVIQTLSQQHTAGDKGSYFVGLGVINRAEWDRMQDVQLASELLILLIDGPQHRRDKLNEKYELYRQPSPLVKKAVDEKAELLVKICEQIWTLFGGQLIQNYHFPRNAENDFYALVGALDHRGMLTHPQLKAHADDVSQVLSEFRRQTNLYVDAVRDASEAQMTQFEGPVVEYASTFLGGQVNSEKRRDTRIAVWEQVINDVVSTVDEAGFSLLQRQLIWAKSADKMCARCGQPVEWKDYHAGHKLARSLGGPSIVTNGQVEHQACNQLAGAS